MSHHHKAGLPNCQNCHYPLAELDKFCPNCGQQNTDGHVSLHDLWHEVTHYFLHVDNKIFATIRDLLIPGKLTDEFFKGHRKRYIHPIQLFFVIGVIMPYIMGSMWHKAAAENHLDEGFIKEKQLYRNDLLFEMDSTIKHDSSRFGRGIRPVLDSFLVENYQRANVKWSKIDTSDNGYASRYYRILDKMQDTRKAIKLLSDTLQIDKGFVDKPLINNRLADCEAYLSKLKYDSIQIVAKFAEVKNKSYKYVLDRWQAGAMGYGYGKSLAMKGAKPTPLTFDSIMRYPVDYDPIQARLDLKRRTIKRDSTGFDIWGSKLKISDLDLSNMPYDDLIEQYKVTDWKEKIMVKQAKKFGEGGMDSLMRTYNEKSTWITVFSIMPAALLLLLMYKSQNRLYVEHVVFLIHYSTLGFIISALLLIQKDWMIYTSLGINIIALAFAIKRFYQQNWGKTILKSVIFYVCNAILGMVIALIGIVLSILLG
jgi:hypothetical protein